MNAAPLLETLLNRVLPFSIILSTKVDVSQSTPSNEPAKKIIPNIINAQNSHTTYFKISAKTGEKSRLALIFG